LLTTSAALALLPTTWGGSKRLEPVREYLSRVIELGSDARKSPVVLALLQPPLRMDWPARVGPIDLDIHDLPHASSQTEWWYYNAHLTIPEENNREISVFVCFFRICKHIEENGKRHYSHALTWAICDPKSESYHSEVLLESDSPEMILKSMQKGKGMKDKILRKAFMEVLEKGNVPLPDKLFSTDPNVSTEELDLDYETSTLKKDSEGRYVLTAKHSVDDLGLTLTFNPKKAAVRHGDHGVVPGHEGDEMFYYFIPRCGVDGTVTINGKECKVQGQGWYDHEFGGHAGKEFNNIDIKRDSSMDYAWNWVAAQLDDNSEVTAAVLIDPANNEVLDVKAVVVDSKGVRSQFDGKDGVVFEVSGKEDAWCSVKTFRSYPTAFHLTVPGADMELDITATFADQEFVSLIAKPAFWEGRCDVSGTIAGKKTKGLAFIERNGFGGQVQILKFFKGVGKVVRKSVADMYESPLSYDAALNLVADKDTEHYMEGIPLDVLDQTLLQPVRLIADRGGKSWRSYASLACVDVVGGDSRKYVQWVAMPEFMHVGSLIVDDIQDKSETRRGGPCSHLVYGEPLCINAGTAAYFQCQSLIKVPSLSAEQTNKCYELYFAALRAGHAGQALDIYGNDYLMDEVVETGDEKLLEKRILAIHRLKTAVPAGTLARMGAYVGGGSEEQVECIGRYFEGVGISFQIMDDVLNLRGLYTNKADKKSGTKLKTLGEDIMEGKVTFPVMKAMGIMKEKQKRKELWEAVKAKPQDQEEVNRIIALLESVGAIDACVTQAEEILETSWRKLDPVVPDSFAKMMLRAFGWFVIERVC